jgi:hypothetical protein
MLFAECLLVLTESARPGRSECPRGAQREDRGQQGVGPAVFTGLDPWTPSTPPRSDEPLTLGRDDTL